MLSALASMIRSVGVQDSEFGSRFWAGDSGFTVVQFVVSTVTIAPKSRLQLVLIAVALILAGPHAPTLSTENPYPGNVH